MRIDSAPTRACSRPRLSLALFVPFAVGCGGSEFQADAKGGYSSTDGSYGFDTGATSPTPTTPPPPEEEEDLLLLPPAQTDVHVFVANPARNTVTRINVATLDVDTTPVGTSPEIVLTTSDFARAVVFNAGDDSVTVLDAATLEAMTVDVRDNLNAMVLSPDGRFAVLWHDTARDDPFAPPPDGLQSFSEVSVVDTISGAHFPMPVGLDPKMVRFTPDSTLAVVVSDAYLATIDLTEDDILADLIELAPGVLDPPEAEEVIVAADGSFAWVRQFGATEILVVDLDARDVGTVPAGLNPTDLDLSPDGTEAVAVARDSHELWVYDATDPFAAPNVVPLPAAGYGSLLFDPTGAQGVLYTTASLLEQYAVWDTRTGEVVERALVKPVANMAVTPTGGSLMVFHTLADGPMTEPVFSDKWALTLIDLDDFRSNPLLLPAEPLAYANSTDGRLGYFIMTNTPYFEVLDYVTLLHEQYTLPSIPSFIGVLPDLAPEDNDEPYAWISQEHPLGRISFYDPDQASLETLTGFELNSGIEEEGR